MKVHIGHSTAIGAMCGTGSKKGNTDITVSEWAFFREIASRHRCHNCVLLHYPYDGAGQPVRTDETLDRFE